MAVKNLPIITLDEISEKFLRDSSKSEEQKIIERINNYIDNTKIKMAEQSTIVHN